MKNELKYESNSEMGSTLVILTTHKALQRSSLEVKLETNIDFFDKYVYWSSHSKVTFVNTSIKFMRYKYDLWMHLCKQMIGYFYIYLSSIIYTFSNKFYTEDSYKNLVP